MITFKYKIKNPCGIHARPAGHLASLAKKYDGCTILVNKGDGSSRDCNASNILSIMGEQFKCGDDITFKVISKDGLSEKDIKNELFNLLERHF